MNLYSHKFQAIAKLTTAEAARYCGCSPRTMEGLRQRGGGPRFLKLGRSVLYELTELDAWLEAARRESTSDTGPSILSRTR